MFGLNYPNQIGDQTQNWNTNAQVIPLRKIANLSQAEWFGHGFLKYPPAAGEFMDLPSGGTFTGCELSCNRAFTTMRDPRRTDTLPTYACTQHGPLHTVNQFGQPYNLNYFGGTSLAIAYTSDESALALRPQDLTVISVNHTSVWWRETTYEIPANMPKCPEGGCLCTWNWIHNAGHGEGYGAEIYNVLYRCNVTGRTSTQYVVGQGQVPKICENSASSCVKGPKTPMYIYQGEGNNMPEIGDPPTYNSRYGFSDGAQTDALVGAGSSNAQPTSTDGTSPLDAAWRVEASVSFVLKALLPALWVALSR